MGHVHRLPGGIEPPLEEDRILRVGSYFTADSGSLIFGHAKHLNLAWFAVWRIWKIKMLQNIVVHDQLTPATILTQFRFIFDSVLEQRFESV